jgi:hypothetical protein
MDFLDDSLMFATGTSQLYSSPPRSTIRSRLTVVYEKKQFRNGA